MFPIIISSIAINTSTKFCLKTTIGARANIRPDNKVQYSILPLALYSDVRRALIPTRYAANCVKNWGRTINPLINISGKNHKDQKSPVIIIDFK